MIHYCSEVKHFDDHQVSPHENGFWRVLMVLKGLGLTFLTKIRKRVQKILSVIISVPDGVK